MQDTIRLKQSEGMFLLQDGLLHLDPTWLNELLRAILDHRLQDPAASVFWETELEAFADLHPRLDFDQLVNAHQTFCDTGTLTASYLKFLWREVKDIDGEGFFDRLLETMRKHGVVFSGLGGPSTDSNIADSGGGCTILFVPVRLPAYVSEKKLEEFECLSNEWRRQLVFRVWQSYVPPGVIGLFMARLLDIDEIQFHCGWRRGISFMMGGSEVLLYLNAPVGRKAGIEVNVVGPERSDEVQSKVKKLAGVLRTVLKDNFRGLRFDSGVVRTIKGHDALMEKMDTLKAHLDVRLDETEGKLDLVAASSRQSLTCLKSLQAADFPYPHLVVVRDHMPTSGCISAGGGCKKRVLSKAMFKSFCSRVRTVGKKEMRLQFLCPYDFSPVPCGPDGDGYAFGKARDWVKKVFPAVQVCAPSREALPCGRSPVLHCTNLGGRLGSVKGPAVLATPILSANRKWCAPLVGFFIVVVLGIESSSRSVGISFPPQLFEAQHDLLDTLAFSIAQSVLYRKMGSNINCGRIPLRAALPLRRFATA